MKGPGSRKLPGPFCDFHILERQGSGAFCIRRRMIWQRQERARNSKSYICLINWCVSICNKSHYGISHLYLYRTIFGVDFG